MNEKPEVNFDWVEHRACSKCLYVPCGCGSSDDICYPQEAEWCATDGCGSDALNTGKCPSCTGFSDAETKLLVGGGTLCVLKR